MKVMCDSWKCLRLHIMLSFFLRKLGYNNVAHQPKNCLRDNWHEVSRGFQFKAR